MPVSSFKATSESSDYAYAMHDVIVDRSSQSMLLLFSELDSSGARVPSERINTFHAVYIFINGSPEIESIFSKTPREFFINDYIGPDALRSSWSEDGESFIYKSSVTRAAHTVLAIQSKPLWELINRFRQQSHPFSLYASAGSEWWAAGFQNHLATEDALASLALQNPCA